LRTNFVCRRRSRLRGREGRIVAKPAHGAPDWKARAWRMAKGTVKWFNTEKGYGFIQPADGGKDIFVHITAVQAAGLQTLKDNQPIEYELIDGRDGRKSAGALKV
jgi:CspA family cold shock protein